MRRLSHILFNVLTVLSLMLLAGTAWLCVRGARTSDVVWLEANGRQYRVTSTAGRFEWLNCPLPPDPEQRQFPLLTSRSDEEPAPPPPPRVISPCAARPWHCVIAHHPAAQHDVGTWDWRACGLGRYTMILADRPSNVYGSARVWTLAQWIVGAAASVLPIIALLRWRRERRPQQHVAAECCTACGYDLRATPDRCPECGMMTTATA